MLTLFDLTMVYLGHVTVLNILQLIYQSQVFVHALLVINIVLSVVHQVFVRGLSQVVDVDLPKQGVGCVIY